MDEEYERTRECRLEDGKGMIGCEDHHRRKDSIAGFALLQHLPLYDMIGILFDSLLHLHWSICRMSSQFALASFLFLLVFLLGAQLKVATAWEDKDFFSSCRPARCSKHGPEIRFPFRLDSINTPSSCGLPCMTLSCSGQDTILHHKYSFLGSPYKVNAIDYKRAVLSIVPLAVAGFNSSCPLLKSVPVHSLDNDYGRSPNLRTCEIYELGTATLVSCSAELTPAPAATNAFAGPIPCLSNATHFSYLVDYHLPTFFIPVECEVVSNGPIPIPHFASTEYKFREIAERILNFSVTALYLSTYGIYGVSDCTHCEEQGRSCAFSLQRNQTFCMRRSIISN